MDLTTIRSRIRAKGISSSYITDGDLDILVDAALDEYSNFKPDLVITLDSAVITTVADTSEYDLPEDAYGIVTVFWQPDADTTLYNSLLGEHIDVNYPSDFAIEFNKVAQLRRYFGGAWRVYWNEDGERKIILMPVPTTSDTKVPLLYSTRKTLSTMNSVEDSLFEQLVYGLALEVKSQKMLENSAWRAGAYSVSAAAGQTLFTSSQKVLDEVRGRLSSIGSPAARQYPRVRF